MKVRVGVIWQAGITTIILYTIACAQITYATMHFSSWEGGREGNLQSSLKFDTANVFVEFDLT